MMGVMASRLAIGTGSKQDPAHIETLGRWMATDQRRLYLLCYRLLQDRDEADSATQDSFLKAYRALQKENAAPLEDVSKWLTRIAVNTCLDRLRSQRWQFWRKRPKPEAESTVLSMARATDPDAERQVLAAQIAVRIECAIKELSIRQKAVFTLRHYEDRSLEEIGEILGLEVGTVKAHMARAVAKLRVELKDLYELKSHAGSESKT